MSHKLLAGWEARVAFRHALCAFLMLCATAWAGTPLTLRAESSAAPSGGYAQIQVYADSPVRISQGTLEVDLDASVFGAPETVGILSAAGDVYGYAYVTGTRIVATFASRSGGIGQLPGVPVFTVTVPVLAGVSGSGFVALTMPDSIPALLQGGYPVINSTYPQGAWSDPQGNAYDVTLVSGSIGVAGSLSVRAVTPGGGLLPVGTVLRIDGTGFDAKTQVTADGVSFSTVQYMSPAQMNVTLGSAAEIAGVPFHVQTGNAQPVNFFPAPASSLGQGVHVVLPQVSQSSGEAFSSRGAILILQNPSASAVDVRVLKSALGAPESSVVLTVPPGGLAGVSTTGSENGYAFPEQPLRMAQIVPTLGPPYLQSAAIPDSPPGLGLHPQFINITADAQVGTATPAQKDVVFFGTRVQAATYTTSGEKWFSLDIDRSSERDTLTINFDAAGLSPGTYQGTITATPVIPPDLTGFVASPSKITVALRVSTVAMISAQASGFSGSPSPDTLQITSSGNPVAFAITASTSSGGNWLSTDVTSGVTPATVHVLANTAGLAGGYYTGNLHIVGPGNAVDESVFLTVQPVPPPALSLSAGQAEMDYSGEAGSTFLRISSGTSFLNVPAGAQVTVDPPTTPWLTAQPDIPAAPLAVAQFTVDARGLAPGTYTAAIVCSGGGQSAHTTIKVTVFAKPTHVLSVTPSSLHFVAQAGIQSAIQTLTVGSQDGPVVFGYNSKLGSPVQIVKIDSSTNTVSSGFVTPVTFSLAVVATQAGSYQDTLTFTNSTGSVSIPLTVEVTAGPVVPPVISSIVHAASELRGPVAPGEIVTIRGQGVGPAQRGLTLDAQGRVSAGSVDTQVLINGVAAPIVYGSVSQWNVVVPYEVDGSATATVQAIVNGLKSAVWTVPVAPSSPAFFTVSATGLGPVAAVNQDGTINSATNPAPRGTAVSFYLTGEGQTTPSGVTGTVSTAPAPLAKLPVTANILDTPMTILYAGEAPGLTSGVLQVNAVIPQGLVFGGSLRISAKVGDATSPAGVSVFIQ